MKARTIREAVTMAASCDAADLWRHWLDHRMPMAKALDRNAAAQLATTRPDMTDAYHAARVARNNQPQPFVRDSMLTDEVADIRAARMEMMESRRGR